MNRSTSRRRTCLIDNSAPKQLSQILIVLLLIGSVRAQTVESGQFTTTVKKELLPTTESTLLLAAAAVATTTDQPQFASEDESSLLKPIVIPPEALPESEQAEGRGSGGAAESGLLPGQAGLFSKDAVDVRALDQMDCHMRNLDYCYAGMMGAAGKALPETDDQLEMRCDEMRAMTSCMALYNRRCATMKVFSMLAPMANMEQTGAMMPEQMSQMPVPLDAVSSSSSSSSSRQQQQNDVKLADLSALCSPQAKTDRSNKLLRQRLFQVARCVNQRIPQLAPCIEDLKAAVQLFYEPRRALPLKPTCCALSRFRNCSMGALDNVCGLSSFAQLESSFSSGPAAMLKVVDRICRQGASKFDSPFCQEVLPPSGMKAPQRRGHRASKLAKALDLISFAPAAQL